VSRLFFFWLLVTYAFSSIKSAAPGTIFSVLHKAVDARAVRFAFGMDIFVPYNYHDPEHRARPRIDRADGTFVPHGWNQIVAIVSRISHRIYFSNCQP
jgi:hypothetical protein